MSLPPLSPDQLVKPRHFEWRVSFLFAMLFLSMGAHLPYFPLWLESKGFDAEQIAYCSFHRTAPKPLDLRNRLLQ